MLIKTNLFYDVVPYAKVRDQDGFTNQLRTPRKTLELERRILVLLRNAGCNAVPHPNDFVYDSNPHLEGPYLAEDRKEWKYTDQDMLDAEPYLVMEAVQGQSLAQLLDRAPGKKLSEMRALRIMCQVADVLHFLHQPKAMRAGMTWQLIYQDLKPANLLISSQDRVTVIDLGGCQLLNLDTSQKLLPGAPPAVTARPSASSRTSSDAGSRCLHGRRESVPTADGQKSARVIAARARRESAARGAIRPSCSTASAGRRCRG